jgi:hypothetical protein
MSGINKKRSKEHAAWNLLKERVDHLNCFAGNRSEMARFTEMMETAWREAESSGNAVEKKLKGNGV